MAKHYISKGLNLPITGEPEQIVSDGNRSKKVALLGEDYINMKPTLAVSVGDIVKLGQLLFTDKKMPGVKYTSPAAGKVVEINRGEKRKFLSIVIEITDGEEITFQSYSEGEIEGLSKETVTEQLVDSGQWTSFKARPFSKVAEPGAVPHSIFVTATDTNPLAPSVEKIIELNRKDFNTGLKIISKLTEGKIFLCKSDGANIQVDSINSLSVEEFSGPHPAGNPGTHIHFLDPVGKNKIVWYINAQDVIAIGILFTTGSLHMERVISLAGPSVKSPRLIRARIGASVEDIIKGELNHDPNSEIRVVSGSLLSGHTASGPTAYLGRYHQQISVIKEGKEKVFLGWLSPGLNLFSLKRILLSSLTPGKKFSFTSALHGSGRAIVPVGSYEKVMPLDILPTFLLRSLMVNDVEEAEKLGCLELDEEDLALCSFVCPSKIDYGTILRRNLTLIEKEG